MTPFEIEARGFICDRLSLGSCTISELRLALLSRYGSVDPHELLLAALGAAISEREQHEAAIGDRDRTIKNLRAGLLDADDEAEPW